MQVLTPEGRTNLVTNIANHLKDAQEFIQKRAVRNFSCTDPEYGHRIQELLNKHKVEVNGFVSNNPFSFCVSFIFSFYVKFIRCHHLCLCVLCWPTPHHGRCLMNKGRQIWWTTSQVIWRMRRSLSRSEPSLTSLLQTLNTAARIQQAVDKINRK